MDTNLKALKHISFQLSLWGNKCDLSISFGSAVEVAESDPGARVDALQSNVIVDDTDTLWQETFSGQARSNR